MCEQKKIPCVEIDEKSLFSILRQVGGTSRARFAITQNQPSSQAQFGFPIGANYLQADDIGLQYYVSKNANAVVVTPDEFIEYCKLRWRL